MEFKSGWCPVSSGAPTGSIVEPVLFHTFISDLDEGNECAISTFADDAKLGGCADLSEGREAVERDQEWLETMRQWRIV